MKRAIYKIPILIFLAVLGSCEKAEEIIFQGPYHARFTETESEVVENYSDPFNLNFNEPKIIDLHIAS